MMEKDFDFNAIGKRTPFRTPEGFFENAKADILHRADEERRRRKRFRLHTGLSVALAIAAMVCGIVFFLGEPQEMPVEPYSTEWMAQNATDAVDLYVRDRTDQELEEWIELSENDIFYELTTENLNEDEN
jgi:hypothetical protein